MTTISQARPLAARAVDVDRRSTAGRTSAAIVFAGMGLVLVALAMALPLSLGVIEREGIAVAAADLALAQRLSAVAWVAAVIGAINFAAALVVLDRGAIAKRMSVVVAGSGVLLAIAAHVAIVARGGVDAGAGVANVVAAIYGIALIGIVLARPAARGR